MYGHLSVIQCTEVWVALPENVLYILSLITHSDYGTSYSESAWFMQVLLVSPWIKKASDRFPAVGIAWQHNDEATSYCIFIKNHICSILNVWSGNKTNTWEKVKGNPSQFMWSRIIAFKMSYKTITKKLFKCLNCLKLLKSD